MLHDCKGALDTSEARQRDRLQNNIYFGNRQEIGDAKLEDPRALQVEEREFLAAKIGLDDVSCQSNGAVIDGVCLGSVRSAPRTLERAEVSKKKVCWTAMS